MRLFSLFTSITHTFFIYLQQTAEEQKSFSSASEAQNTMDALDFPPRSSDLLKMLPLQLPKKPERLLLAPLGVMAFEAQDFFDPETRRVYRYQVTYLPVMRALF